MPRFAFITPALTAVLLAASASAMAQAPAPSGDARARYEQEREKCMTNNTQDSLATCLREANNALDASRKGQLSNPGPAASENTTQRCEAFQTAAEQAECVRRTQSSSVSGSVSGGGVLRESVTTTVIPAK
ncbi:hypothetical protein [Acidovorax sp. Leaf78]|uniref:hypothetical protein n=1 Tax=Acidovorax sp. Leaf78 TaxID=1736237 RepID=UPI0006F36BED|nr:hypothetical protein [Acidovorax sp. Leaf78]KQO15491.1 hypothetical protein ASF16_16195 [Acidovorax sp. Leaf78]RZJ51256.1 MAG: hypothetical protein EON49_25270 [Acidovorax sp.]